MPMSSLRSASLFWTQSALYMAFSRTKIHFLSKVANMKHVQHFHSVNFTHSQLKQIQVHLNCTSAINKVSINLLYSGSESTASHSQIDHNSMEHNGT